MKTQEEKFYSTCEALAAAFKNKTLQAGNCYACAVGTLVAAGMGYEIVDDNNIFGMGPIWVNPENTAKHPHPGWNAVFFTSGWEQYTNMDAYYANDDIKREIDSTGYTVEQLAKIEHVFEITCKREHHERMFSENPADHRPGIVDRIALLAVVEVLATIHEVSRKDKAKAYQLFNLPEHEEDDDTSCSN